MITSVAFFLLSIILFYVVLYLVLGLWFRGDRSTYMKIFLALGIAISLWELFNSMSLLITTELYQWMYPLFLTTTTIVPVLLLLYSLHFVGSKLAKSRVVMVILFALATLDIVIILTNAWHGELYSGFNDMIPVAGRLFPVHALIGYGSLLVAYIFLIRYIVKNIRKTPSLVFIAISMALPVVINVLFSFDIIHLGIDVTPFAFVLMIITFSVYSINLRLFDNRNTATMDLFNKSLDAFLIMDNNGTVIDKNPALKDIIPTFDFKPKDSNINEIAKHLEKITFETYPPDVLNRLYSPLEEIDNAELALNQNGHITYLILSRSNIFKRSQHAGSIIILSDITEYKRAIEEKIELETKQESIAEIEEALNEARIANQSKSIFLAQMSHEIRTPLHAIIG
ncbi:MAG: hypothetical protein LBC73_01785, partial [Oscillospiraceae bacterium]|nr:hypothetical protein [Oscillospiraceae bacterium]